MMSNRLDLNQQERINRKYHEHPLFCACQATFRNYLAGMRYLMFSPTEVFVESVEVIDNLLEEGTDKLEFIRSLWQNLIIRYKLWPLLHPGVVDDKEYETAVCSVFYTVAIVMSRHDDNYYSEQIKNALLSEIDKHTSIVKQEEDKVIICLSKYGEELEQWLSSYADSETYLSDEIDDVAHDRKPRSILKAVSRTNRQERPKPDYTKFSFKLKPKGRFKSKENKALEWLHTELTAKKFIMDVKDIKINEDFSQLLNVEEKNKLVFNAVFSGVDTDYYIVWIATAKELGYFINQLEERGVLSWKEGPRKWQVCRNRIWQRKREYEIVEDTGKRQYHYIIEPFKEKAFDKNLVPADTGKLDEILDIIAPLEKKIDTNIGNEIEEDFRIYSDFEDNNDNIRGERLSDGYRDTSHKRME